MKQLLELRDKTQTKERELETEAQRRKLEVQLLEEKNNKMLEQVTTLTAEIEERDREIVR